MVEMERTEWSGVICDKKIRTKLKLLVIGIPDSDSTDVALRLRNMANVMKSVLQQQRCEWCDEQRG